MLVSKPDSGVCLVDHQQVSQLNKAIDVDRIVGVIDHHALQNATIVTDRPIYIDIRPWGSMSSIVTHMFLSVQQRPTKSTAGMLLCAILSDTLNLMGPTTTDWDRGRQRRSSLQLNLYMYSGSIISSLVVAMP